MKFCMIKFVETFSIVTCNVGLLCILWNLGGGSMACAICPPFFEVVS
jgi:hypothetical protein